MIASVPIEVTVNGARRAVDVAPNHTLLDVLRDDLALTGAKECCLVGECGACTVIVDGRTVDSCLVLAVEADGSEILTVEGLAEEGGLSPLQAAFLDKGAVQCGFCIPGQLMSAHVLLEEHPHPDPGRDRGGDGGQPLPLRLLRADLRRDPHHRRGNGPMTGSRVGDSPNRVGGIDRVTGAQRYLADLPVADALHAKLVTLDCARARILGDRRHRGARPARRPPGHDGGRPAHAHAPVSGRRTRTGPSSRSARPSTTATRWRWSSPTPATWPRRPPGSSAWSTRSCRRCSRSREPSRRMRRSCRIPRCAPATASPAATCSPSTGSAGGTSTPRPPVRTSWWRAATRSRW